MVTRTQELKVRLPRKTLMEVDRMARRLHLRSRSAFVKEAVRMFIEDARNTRVIVIRRWTRRKAKEAALEYVQQRKRTYVSDIADALEMDLRLAFGIVDELVREGRLEDARRRPTRRSVAA